MDSWKTILFFQFSPYFLALLLLVSGVASKGLSPLRPRLFVGMILILIFAEATEGELKSVELDDLWWIYCCPQNPWRCLKISVETMEKTHLLCNVYLYSIYASFPKMFHLSVLAR